MKFKIRTKVLLGILFLFVEFVCIGVLSMYYISSIKYSSELAIKNNYWSVRYSENMVQAIDESHTAVNSAFLNKQYHYDPNSVTVSNAKFEENLRAEEKNITELGEKELVQSIRQKFEKYKALLTQNAGSFAGNDYNFYLSNVLPLVNELKAQTFTVSTLNMHAIVQKNDNLKEKVNHIYKVLSILLTLCFLLTFSFMINFPNYIAEPIKKLTDGIKDIIESNFQNRIRISSNDEFRQLGEAINSMAEKLEISCPEVVHKKIVPDTTLEENLMLQNIQSLLESIRPLLESISTSKNSDSLKKQAEVIKEVELELYKNIR